jgi:hypothetical protein
MTDVIKSTQNSGADADLVAITSPKETVCEPTCRNPILVGQETLFEVFIQNSGDTAITELGYKAQVWNSDANGNPLNIAKDASGSDLEWDNPDVICDDTTVCDDQSLASGDVFKGGKTMIQYFGANAVWTPAVGIYVVQIEVYSAQDTEPTNDVQQVYVEVVEYLDIDVELSWDDGSTVATGAGSKAFTIAVEFKGPSNYITHDLSILIDVNGDLASATAEDGTDLLAASLGSLVHSVNVGSDQVVTVYENETDSLDSSNEVRTVMSSNTNNGIWEFQGSVTPDSSINEAVYFIDVELGGYSLYGQFESCQEFVFVDSTDAEGNPITTTITYSHFCEESFLSDDITNNNNAELTGAITNLDDIKIVSLSVNQGYNSDGTGVATHVFDSGEPGDLSVGTSYIDASVEHRGSDVTELYDWNVTFTITNLDTNEVITETVNECVQGVDPSYNHALLGIGSNAFSQGHACTMIEFDVGTYTVEANLVLEGTTTDQKLSNNQVTMEKEVRNNLPVVSSLDLVTQGDLILGMENMLEFEVSTFDADDVTGEGLTYTWVGEASSTPLAGCGGIGGVGRTCSTPVIQDFVTTFPVKVTVADAHGGSVTEEIVIEIWNDAVASDTTTSGITMDYSLTYWSKSAYTISVEDGDTTACEGITLPDSSGGELSGVYTPVAVIDYNPVTTYAANDVLAQSMNMVFDSSLGASSLWFTTNCNSATLTQLLADGATNSPDDSTKSVLSAVLSGPVLPAGQFLLIVTPLQPTGPPSASMASFYAESTPSGIHMTWSTTGTMLSNEMFSISILNDADSEVFEINLPYDQFTYTYNGAEYGPSISYTIDIAVCNNHGICSTPVGTATADGTGTSFGVFASNVSVQPSESVWLDNRPSWELSWDVVGASSGVDLWKICANLLEPALSPSDSCTGYLGSATNYKFSKIILDVYSEPIVDLYFTIFAVNALGDYSFMNAENEVNSIGSITYDKTEQRVGWPDDYGLDCDKELFADGTLTCMDGGTFLGGELGVSGALILGGEWNLQSDQAIFALNNNLQLINFSTTASGDQNLNITCMRGSTCSFKNSVLKQSYPYVFDSESTVTIENSEFKFVSQNNANDIQPHFITYPEIRPSKSWLDRDVPYVISPSEIITFIPADSEEDGTTFSGDIVWGTYASEFKVQSQSNICLRDHEQRNNSPDLLSQYESLNTGIEQMYLEIVEGNETVYSHRLQNFDYPGDEYDEEFLCSNLEGLETPVLLSYSVNGTAVDLQRSLIVRYEANNSWGDYSQMIEFTEGSVEQPAPYMKLTTHSSDDVKYGTKSNFVTFLKIENPTQSTYNVNLICTAEISENVLFNNKTMTVLSNQTMLYQIEWMLEAPGQYDLSCKVDKHSHYPNLFDDNTDDASEIAIVIIEEKESEGFLGGAAIALGAGGIGVFIAILLIVLFIRKQKAKEEEEEEEDEEYVSGYYAKHNRPTQVENRTNISRVPPFSFEGSVDESGYEICEYPVGSGKWFWKDFDTQRWVEWE